MEACDNIVADVDDSDVYYLLDASKDFAQRHIAALMERLLAKIDRANGRYN